VNRAELLVQSQCAGCASGLVAGRILRNFAKEPDTPLAYAQLAQCFVSLKDYPEAVPVLRKVVELRPDMTLPHFQLGVALLETS
jgi:hypothetical protein